MKKIIIVNGPNLNLLGEREKKQYGNFTLKDVETNCEEFAKNNKLAITFYQSNIDKFDLIDIFFPFNCIFAIIELINDYNN